MKKFRVHYQTRNASGKEVQRSFKIDARNLEEAKTKASFELKKKATYKRCPYGTHVYKVTEI